MRLGETQLYDYLQKFGFGQSTGLGLPGETSGILRALKSWATVDVATHSFGQGIAVTPLQMARAISAIANGGNLPELRVVKSYEPYTLTRVISERAAQDVREMMYGVVEDEHGTGKRARIEGLRIGGKTGTAQKPKIGARGYQAGAYIASFIGFVDARPLGYDKRLTLMVAVDEPNTTSIYGGTLAAPVFKRIIKRSLQLNATKQHLVSADKYKQTKAQTLLKRVSL
ncbi:MAG: penicillin-binding transpeptidase domain-containing protein [Bdellovibrionota bacterium]